MKHAVLNYSLIAVVINSVLASPARAEEEVAAPLSQAELIEQLDQRIRVLDRKLELEQEAAAERAKKTPVVSADNKGFSIQSPDGAYVLRLRGVANIDARTYLDSTTSDTFQLRAIRPSFEGTLAKIYDFRVTPDFGNGRTIILDAYADARLNPAFKLRIGKAKAPFGLERLQSDSDTKFIERGLPNNLIPNRDIGVQAFGDLLDGRISYALSYSNGVADGGSSESLSPADADSSNRKSYGARVFTTPFKDSDSDALRGLGFGLAADRSDDKSAASPKYRSPGQQDIFSYRSGTAASLDGDRLRVSPQAYYYNGGLGVLGEYVVVHQDVSNSTKSDTLTNTSWQLAASYLLTGEDASYKGVKPKRAFELGKEGWGAWELVARYSTLKIDDDAFSGGANSFADPTKSSRDAKALAAGVNWYLNDNVRVALNYEYTRYSDGGGGTVTAPTDRPNEKILFSRVQIAY